VPYIVTMVMIDVSMERRQNVRHLSTLRLRNRREFCFFFALLPLRVCCTFLNETRHARRAQL